VIRKGLVRQEEIDALAPFPLPKAVREYDPRLSSARGNAYFLVTAHKIMHLLKHGGAELELERSSDHDEKGESETFRYQGFGLPETYWPSDSLGTHSTSTVSRSIRAAVDEKAEADCFVDVVEATNSVESEAPSYNNPNVNTRGEIFRSVNTLGMELFYGFSMEDWNRALELLRSYWRARSNARLGSKKPGESGNAEWSNNAKKRNDVTIAPHFLTTADLAGHDKIDFELRATHD